MASRNFENNQQEYRPIPLEVPSVTGWKEIPIIENNEPLVAIGPFSGNEYGRIYTSSIYYGEREDSPYSRDQIKGALITSFARQEVADQILEAESNLPEGMHLIILDSFRTLDAQQSLYDNFYQKLKSQISDVSDQELSEYTQKFVSIPSTDTKKPSPHNTGGAIDVAIYKLPIMIESRVSEIDNRINEIGHDESSSDEVYKLEMERVGLIAQNAELLNFGTQWDFGGKESAISYFEILAEQRELTAEEEDAKQNRRILYGVMKNAGFEAYSDEWWHFNSTKSQMGAKSAGLPNAEFGAINLTKDNWHHELVRRQHLKGTEFLLRSPVHGIDKLGRHIVGMEIAQEAAIAIGDMRETSLPKAAVIEPPDL